jgi:hypothetical protein
LIGHYKAHWLILESGGSRVDGVALKAKSIKCEIDLAKNLKQFGALFEV